MTRAELISYGKAIRKIISEEPEQRTAELLGSPLYVFYVHNMGKFISVALHSTDPACAPSRFYKADVGPEFMSIPMFKSEVYAAVQRYISDLPE